MIAAGSRLLEENKLWDVTRNEAEIRCHMLVCCAFQGWGSREWGRCDEELYL